MNRTHYILLLLTTVFAVSCVEDYNPEIKDSDQHLVVIEGTIMSDTVCTFGLSTTYFPYSNAGRLASEQAPGFTRQAGSGVPKLSVEGTDGSHYEGVTEESEGSLTSPVVRMSVKVGRLNPNEKYYVKVQYQSDTYESVPARPLLTPEIERIDWMEDEKDNSVAISVTSQAPADGQPCHLLWQSTDDWEVIANYPVYMYYENKQMHYYTEDVTRGWKHGTHLEPVVASSSLFPENRVTGLVLYRIPNTDDRISVIYSTEVAQRVISKEEYEYLTVERQQYSGMGGIFTPMPSELPTNIRCTTSGKRAMGFVGVSQNTTRKRVYIMGGDLHYKRPYDCMKYVKETLNFEQADALVKSGFQVFQWSGNGAGKWMPRYCLDVRETGATLQKPEWWAY